MIEPLRKFWLENENGDRKPLNGEEGVFFLKPTGLGVELNNSFGRAGNAFFLTETVDPFTQASMGGDLVFDMPRPHDLYTSFVNWVLQAKELTLVYMPTTTAYRRRISVVSLKKDEPDRPVAITIPFTFVALTPWYTNDVDTYSLGVVGDGFRAMDEADIDASFPEEPLDEDEFDLVLDGGEGLEAEDDRTEQDEEGESRVWDDEDEDCDYLRLTETDMLESDIIIDPKGQVESSFLLTFEGSATSPVIYIVGIDTGTEYGRVVLNTSFSVNERLEYSTNQLDSYIRKVKNGQSIDLLNAVDISYEVFPRLSTTEACRIVMASDSEMRGQLKVAVQRYVVGV